MTFLQHFISPLLRSLVLTFCIVCCVCIARRNKDDEPSAASPSYQIDSGFDYMPPPPTTNEFMSAREESNEMSPVLPGPPPPITSNASVGVRLDVGMYPTGFPLVGSQMNKATLNSSM